MSAGKKMLADIPKKVFIGIVVLKKATLHIFQITFSKQIRRLSLIYEPRLTLVSTKVDAQLFNVCTMFKISSSSSSKLKYH